MVFWLAYYLGGMLLIPTCGHARPAVLVSITAGTVGDFSVKQIDGIPLNCLF